jgi:hypothetical protein
MLTSESPPGLGYEPLAPAWRLVHALLGVTVHVVMGIFVGMLAARLLRRSRLHWSWAPAGLAGLLPALELVAPSLLTVAGAALLSAAASGCRTHRRDLLMGADLACAARARRTPGDALRRCLLAATEASPPRLRLFAGLPARLLGLTTDGWWLQGDRLVIGIDDRDRPVSIAIGGEHGGTHTLVVGASGSGKTVTQTWIAVRAIERGMGAVVVDPKDDVHLRAQLREAARRQGRRLIEWTPEGPSVYNPYAHGGDSEIADKLLAGERFSEPHYLRQAQRYLGHAVRTLHAAREPVDLAALVRCLNPRELGVLAATLPEEQGRRVHAYLDSLTARQQADLSGVRDRLAILAESDIARWLEPHGGAQHSFDLLGVVRERAIVYFSLESDRRPLLTQMLGSAIVQDLQTTVAALHGSPVPTLVLIDEFAAVAAEQVARLFGRARSAGISLLLGTQELSDLRLPGRELLLEQVLGNLSSVVAHRQVVPASAETIARLAGAEGAWRISAGSDGRFTRTRARECLLRAEELGALGRGRAAVLALGGESNGGGVRIARIHSTAGSG